MLYRVVFVVLCSQTIVDHACFVLSYVVLPCLMLVYIVLCCLMLRYVASAALHCLMFSSSCLPRVFCFVLSCLEMCYVVLCFIMLSYGIKQLLATRVMVCLMFLMLPYVAL